MAAAETARLIASLELQDKNFTRGLRNVERGVGRVDKKLSAFGGFVNRNLARGIDSFASSLVGGVFAGVESLKELEQQQAQTAAVLKSTGGAAGVTADEITNLAEKYEGLNALMGDEVIRGGENMLLTFTNINKKAFEPALAVALDLNTALGKGPEGLTSTVIQVGKALNDPAKGLTALRRVGVAFTKDQEKKIKSLQKEGKLYEAQQLILKELNKEFGGSFAAQGDTTAGKVAKFHDAVEDLQRTFAKALLPVIVKVADKLGALFADPKVVALIDEAGKGLARAFDGVLAAAEKINWGAIAGGLEAAAGFAGELVGWFGKFPDWAQALIVGGFVATKLPIVGDIFSEAAKGLIKGVLGINAGVVNLKAASVVGGGVPGGGAAPVGTAGKLMNAVRVLGAVTIAGASIALLAQTFKGFIDDVGTAQAELLKDVNATSKQGFKETVANLEAVNSNVKNAGPLENLLKGVFGGSEIVRNYELAAARIVGELEAGNLDRADMVKALDALKTAVETSPEAELPGVETAIAKLTEAIKGTPAPKGAPGAHRPPPTPNQGGAPGAFRPVVTAVTAKGQATVNAINNAKSIATRENSAQKTELSNIKNATATLNTAITTKTAQQTAELANIKNASATLARKSEAQQTELSNIKNASATLNTSITTQTSEQTAELGNIKNATATMDTNTKAGLVAATAATTAGNLLSVFQSASQVLAATGTTTAARAAGVSAAAASRNAGSTVSSAMSTAASRIVYAIAANRPIIQSTNVVNNFTRTQRSGATSGSRGGNSFSGYR